MRGEGEPPPMGKNAEQCSLLKNGSESTRELLDGNSTLSKDRVTVVWRARGKAESREEGGEGNVAVWGHRGGARLLGVGRSQRALWEESPLVSYMPDS